MRRGAIVGVAALGITIIAIFLAGMTRSVAGSFALITLAGIAGLGWTMRGYLPRAGVVASVAVLGWVPFAFAGVAWELGRPIVSSHWRCGTPDANMFMFGVMFLFVICAVALGMSMVLGRTRIADGFVRACAYASVVVGTTIAVLAVHRTGVEPDAWVDQLPIVEDGDVAGVHITRNACTVTFASSDRVASYPDGDSLACFPIRVRHDAAHGRFIIQRAHPQWYTQHAFDARTLEAVDITPYDVRDSLKPPAGWVGTAVAGVGSAIAAILIATWLDRRARRFRSGVLAQGTHTGGGWIEIGSGTKHVPEAQCLPIGPVVFEAHDGKPATPRGTIVPRAPAGRAPYRADGSLDVRKVRRGTLADWLDRTLDVRASALAYAIAAVALSCAPLIAARFVGLF